MKKRIFVVVMIMAMILAACGGKTSTGTNSITPVEIKYMMWGSPEELAVWQEVVKDFEVANPNIKVSVDVSDWDSYWEKVQTMIAGGNPPDVFAIDAPLYQDWKSRGALLNLQPYLDSDPKVLDGVYPVTLQVYKLDDGYYGLPRDFQTIVLFYNKDMFDAASLAYPDESWTMDTLRETAMKLTLDTNADGTNEQWGFCTDPWDMELFWSEAIWSFGGEIIDPDHTQTLLTEGKARDAWHFIASMAVEDKSMPDPDTSGQFGGDPFDAGVCAMTTIGHWVVPQYASRGFKFDVAPIPSGPAGRVTSVNSAGFVISSGSKNPDAAWEFLKYAISPAGQTKLTELGFAIPVQESIAESAVFLEQKGGLNQQVFLDALEYAHVKPSFKGYDEWSTVVGDGLYPAWIFESSIDDVLNAIKSAADEVLAKQ